MLEVRRGAGGLRDLGVRGVAENPAVGEHHDRERADRACFGEQPQPLLRVRKAERMRDGAHLERAA